MNAASVRVLAGLLALAAATPAAAQVVLTGEVQAVDAQPIYTPQANMSPLVIRYFVAEGERVEKGDVVLRIDPGSSAGQVRELEAQIEQARARAAKELAELRVKRVDAELALAQAEAALETAKIDAAIPAGLISALDYDRHQGELDRTGREAALKRREFETAREAIARRQQDAELEIEKLQVQRGYHAAKISNAEVRAEHAGVVVHGFNNNWIGGRIDEGSSTMPGSRAGEVVHGSAMRVRAWALAPDRRGLKVGQPVRLAFDALPGRPAQGRITAISGAPDGKPEWGDGRYYTVDIELARQQGLPLLSGMSVRVDVPPAGKTTKGKTAAGKAARTAAAQARAAGTADAAEAGR